jgi:hypothetical protein
VRRWPEQYGFAFLVFVAMVCASFLAGSIHVPKPVPDYALQAAEIYRLEIGAAFFAAFYLVTLAFLLAIGGRGFTKFGPHGLAVEQVIKNGTALRHQARFDLQTKKALNDLNGALGHLQTEIASQQERLESLEANH